MCEKRIHIKEIRLFVRLFVCVCVCVKSVAFIRFCTLLGAYAPKNGVRAFLEWRTCSFNFVQKTLKNRLVAALFSTNERAGN